MSLRSILAKVIIVLPRYGGMPFTSGIARKSTTCGHGTCKGTGKGKIEPGVLCWRPISNTRHRSMRICAECAKSLGWGLR